MPKTFAKSHHHGKIPAGEEGKKLVKKQEICRESRKNIGNTVEPRGKFGHPDFFLYCGVFRYLAGYPSDPKNYTMKIFF